MAVRDVLRMGDPRLLEQAKPVERFGTPELDALLEDMHDTMAALDGAGLAAPQIGVGLQIVIFGVDGNPRYPDAEEVPMTVLIILIAPQAGRLSDRLGARGLAGTGMVLLAISLYLFSRLTETSNFWSLLPAMITGGFGTAEHWASLLTPQEFQSLKERVVKDLAALKKNKPLLRSFFMAESVVYAKD